MIRCALPESTTIDGSMPRSVEQVDLVDEDLCIDDAARADHRPGAGDDAARHLPELPRLAADDDRVPGVGPALIAAHDVRILGEQVDDLALALVAPLRADHDGRWHLAESSW